MKTDVFFNKAATVLKNNREIIIPSVTLLAICFAITLALSLTNLVTADTISKREVKAQNDAMAELLPADRYDEASLTDENGEQRSYHIAYKNNETAGYLFVTSKKGYGGDIKIMTAVDGSGKIIAVTILSAGDETPGLGQNVTKSKFYSQYAGMTDEISVVKNGADASLGQINAVTGATISSRAVTAAVNEAVSLYGRIQAPLAAGAQTDEDVGLHENGADDIADGADASSEEVSADE